MCKLYLDTSAIGALIDKKDRFHHDAINFFYTCLKEDINLYYSDLTKIEFNQKPKVFPPEEIEKIFNNPNLKFKKINYLSNKKLHQEIINIAMNYQNPAPKYSRKNLQNDALHVAIATIAQIPVIISTNFKHLVTSDSVNEIYKGNLASGYDQFIQIIDFQEYNHLSQTEHFKDITNPNLNLKRQNTRNIKANQKINLSKKKFDYAKFLQKEFEFKSTISTCAQCLELLIIADSILKYGIAPTNQQLLKYAESQFMFGHQEQNYRFLNFNQTLKENAKNFNLIPKNEIKPKVSAWLKETSFWINTYINYKDNLTLIQDDAIIENYEKIQNKLNQKKITKISLDP